MKAQTIFVTGSSGVIGWRYDEGPRAGDHICYISNLGKFKSQYPSWSGTQSLRCILEEMTKAEVERQRKMTSE
jgi:CDP-paratose 2-epimerase